MSAEEDGPEHAATAAAAEPQLSWRAQAANLKEAQLIFEEPPKQIGPFSPARKYRQEITKIQKKAAQQTLQPIIEDVGAVRKRPRSSGQDYDADACDPTSRRGCVVMGGSRKRRRTLQKYRKSRKNRKGRKITGRTKGGRKTQKKRGHRRRRRTRRRTHK